jgi:hypothetical protein
MRHTVLVLMAMLASIGSAAAQESAEDRGVPTSMFGTYIGRRELLVYPFFEYYRDHDFEYKPEELGFAGDVDFRGRFRAHERLIFVGYGITSNLAVEFEVASIEATLHKAHDDPSAVPSALRESGLGDVEGQLRWRWNRDTRRPAQWFSYSEVVVPHHRDRPLIGTSGWEFKFGTGVNRALARGLLTVRGAIQYEGGSSSQLDLGEYAVEYMLDLSRRWRVYAGVEGTQDELELITEAQIRLFPHVVMKINNGLGLTSKATDWAPEIGILFSTRR